MSWAYVGAVVLTAASSKYASDRAKTATKKARKQKQRDEANARKAQRFAETEGEGLGNIGNVRLAVDNTIDPRLSKKTAATKLQI